MVDANVALMRKRCGSLRMRRRGDGAYHLEYAIALARALRVSLPSRREDGPYRCRRHATSQFLSLKTNNVPGHRDHLPHSHPTISCAIIKASRADRGDGLKAALVHNKLASRLDGIGHLMG